jgi:hypothetical protein
MFSSKMPESVVDYDRYPMTGKSFQYTGISGYTDTQKHQNQNAVILIISDVLHLLERSDENRKGLEIIRTGPGFSNPAR